jgi:hypothetical protein
MLRLSFPPAGARALLLAAFAGLGMGSAWSALPMPDDASIAAPCNADSVKQATVLLYRDSDLDGARQIARRCAQQGSAPGHAFEKVLALRIHALLAMRTRDLDGLRRAGEALVVEGRLPEYVADGHMLIAFACVFGGQTHCAREHVDLAHALYTQLHADDALAQLQPIEEMTGQLEDQTASH